MRLKAIRLLMMSLLLALCMPTAFAAAASAEKPNVEIAILSPDQVKEYPGAEFKIAARVTNRSNQPIEDMMVYITMADLKKHWTVNLEDYSADQPITIGTLAAGETKEVSLPIRFVYTSQYHLYITATSTKQPWIYSSTAIPIEIMGNTKIDPLAVQIVSIVEPVLLLGGWIVLMARRRRAKNA